MDLPSERVRTRSDPWDVLAVVIPTFRRNGQLLKVLQSIGQQSMHPRVVLVIDNSGDDGSRDAVARFAEEAPFQVDYLPMSTNSGPAGAFASAAGRLASRWPEIEWMMCRGDDNAFDRADAIEFMHGLSNRAAAFEPAVIGVIGGKYGSRSREVLDCGLQSVDFIPGGGMATYNLAILQRESINFNPQLFFGFEELEIGLCLKARGYLLLSDPEWTDISQSPPRRTAPWRTYFRHRNRLLVARRFGSLLRVTLLVAMSIGGMSRRLLLQGAHGDAVANAHGLIDGLRAPSPPRHKYIPR